MLGSVGSSLMDQPHESDRRGSKRRVWHTPVPRLGRNDELQRESEGEDDGSADDPQRPPIARFHSHHRRHSNHDGEPDQESSDEAACLPKSCQGVLHHGCTLIVTMVTATVKVVGALAHLPRKKLQTP